MAGSMKDAVRYLTSIFAANPVPCPLPNQLHTTVASFLERYESIEEHDSQRFHDDLVSLWMKHVAGSPSKNEAFISTLRLVRPALTLESQWNDWWELVLKPTLDSSRRKRSELDDVKEILQSLLLFDAEDDKDGARERISTSFRNKILHVYLARTRMPSSAQDMISPEDEYISSEVESVLSAFGRRRPKDLLVTIDRLFVMKQHRTQALTLLNAFLRLQTPHLHLVLETPLIQHLEQCLLIDASSTVISQALMALLMFLPHITAALTSHHHLPRLFLIYSRLLCWDKFGGSQDSLDWDQSPVSTLNFDFGSNALELAWDKLQQSTDFPDAAPPTLLHYFTFLYGLFPLNFASFIRKPRKFLKSLSFPGADDFDLDQDMLHDRTQRYRRVHLLHPNMLTTTIEDELTENRWVDSDPADIVMECMDLCVAVSISLEDPGPPPTAKLPDLPPIPPIPDAPASDFSLDGHTAGGSVSWRNTQSTLFSPISSEIPDFPEPADTPPRSKSVKSAKSSKSVASSPLLKCRDLTDSPTLGPVKEKPKKPLLTMPLATNQRLAPSSSVDNFAQLVSESGSPTHLEFQNLSIAALQREIMLLRNDLNFERYLKSQHMAHIGQLQRRHMKEATAEADTQNLINLNKMLKAKLGKMNEQYGQLKKETLTSRSQSKKWESELSGKVRSYRDDQKSWQSDEDSLRFELKKTQADCDHLKKIVEKAEAEQLRAQHRSQALELELKDFAKLGQELEAAQAKVMEYESRDKDYHQLVQQRDDLRNDLEVANMRLNSREADRERSLNAYERRIAELESRLQAAEKNVGKNGQLSSSVQQMLDSALAANNAKLANIKKMYQRLQEQKTTIEMKYHELNGEYHACVGKLRAMERTDYTLPDKDPLSFNFSSRYISLLDSKYPPALSTDGSSVDGRDYLSEYISPVSSPVSVTSAHRPSTQASLHPQAVSTGQREPPGPSHNFPAVYDASLDAQFQRQSQKRMTPSVHSSSRSTQSFDTSSSKDERKEKVAIHSEVRYFGRGGAQNISTKKKDAKELKIDKPRTGGFRGLKGIM